MKTTFSFGILGCGMIASTHAAAIRQIPEAQLVGAADVSRENAARFAEKNGIRVYDTFEDMLRAPEIDVVCICTPSRYHAANAIKALEHQKHVVLEKPMALNTAEADLVVEAACRNQCLLTVISQLRFSEDVLRIRKLMEENAFGNISFISLRMQYWRSPEYFSASSWRGRKDFEGGGALMNQGIHGIDLLQYIAGQPRVLKGKITTRSHAVEVEDTAAALLAFENGALGTVEASTCTYPGFPRQLEIHGDKGYVVLRENKIRKLLTETESIDCSREAEQNVNTYSVPEFSDCTMHARQIANLIHAVQGREALVMDAAEGKKSIQIIEDIYRSSEQAD